MAKPGTPVSHGPAPKTFKAWCVSVGRKGCRKFRVRVEGEKEPKMVAYSTGAASSRTIEKMEPVWCEALDDDGAIIRVWQFKERDETEDAPGYLKDDSDTEDERVLKTFAHLIADAYKQGNRQLVEVIQIQGNVQNEERKQLSALRLLNDKLLTSLARKTRVRVATEPEGEGEGEGEGEEDTFMQDMLAPVLQNLVAKAVRKAGGEVAQAIGDDKTKANGAKE
jgi:hypothetical protein